MKIWNLEIKEVSEELKQSYVDNFFNLMCDAKEKPNLIYQESLKYKIAHPHSDMAWVDKTEVLNEICYSYYIENRMISVAAIIGDINFRNNVFR